MTKEGIRLYNKAMKKTINKGKYPYQLICCEAMNYSLGTYSVIISDTQAEIMLEERTLKLKPGDSLILRGRTELCVCKVKGLLYLLHLEPEVFDTIMLSQLADCRIIYELITTAQASLEYLFFDYDQDSLQHHSAMNLIEQCTQQDLFTDKLLRCCIVQYFTNLQRDFVHHLIVSQSTMVSRHPFGQILKYMGENYAEINLKSTAAHFSYNPDYFSAYFHRHSGMTFTEKLFEIRLEQALRYLTMSDLSINELCLTIGFKEKSYFIRKFKQRYHCTPSQYRKQHQLKHGFEALETEKIQKTSQTEEE